MKKNILGVIAIIAAFCVALPSQAQKIKFGVKAGLDISSFSLKGDLKSNIEKDNQTGFFAGLTADLSTPLGLGADIAVLYNQKKMDTGFENEKLQYIDVPLNVKYNIGLGSLASVYVATGPQFSYNIGDKLNWSYVGDVIQNGAVAGTSTTDFALKKSEFSWNVGAGVTVLKHIRVGYNYNIAIGNTADFNFTLNDVSSTVKDAYNGEFKNNTHQVSLTYIF